MTTLTHDQLNARFSAASGRLCAAESAFEDLAFQSPDPDRRLLALESFERLAGEAEKALENARTGLIVYAPD